jgi:hypothetical protein
MKRLDMDQVKTSLVDISAWSLPLGGPEQLPAGEVVDRVTRALAAGFCVAHGTGRILARNGFDVRADRERGYALLESLFHAALARIELGPHSVTPHPMTPARMDVDGFNLNQSFSHDGQIAARAFMTAKCIHFDAATPFIANIYGPNENVRDGLPLICDVRRYCRDRGLSPHVLLENIPNNYNIAIRREHYDDLLEDYAFAYDLDLDDDIVIVMLLNEIEFGFAHGATDPQRRVEGQEVRRPIRHIELQYAEESHYEDWYAYYGLEMAPAKDYQGENLSLQYHGQARRPFTNLVGVDA